MHIEPTWAAIAVLVATLSLHLVGRLLAGWLRSWRGRRRQARAERGERTAEKLLRRMGYAVCARQVATSWSIACDDELHEVALRADLLVERGGQRFVAEVKTGRVAPRLSTAATRRQLLEYRVAYDVDGVLLVDAEAARVMRVDFPGTGPGTGRARGTWAGLLWGLGLGAACGLAAAQWLAGL